MVVMKEINPCRQAGGLNSKIVPPVTFVQALNDKYIDQEEFDDQFKLPKDQSISTEITFVGFGSVSSVQKQLRRLASIDLSDQCIREAGYLDAISGSLNKVSVLNLANNSLTWQEIIKILTVLPNLQEIILTGNDLKPLEEIQFPERTYRKLISITLGRINENWSTIVDILERIWSSVDQVDLWDSHLKSESFVISDNNSFVKNISSLRLSQNWFPDLEWVAHAGQMYALKELDLSKCGLKSIRLNDQIIRNLMELEMLNISHNDIEQWSCISSLNLLPNLKHLICNDNPIFITQKFARSLTVARISHLTHLNREEITPSFRRDSEILYLRQAFKELDENQLLDIDVIHPRYKELGQIYGFPQDLSAKQAVDKYITVELYLEDKSIKKKLPFDMRVSNLHMLCKKLFKMKPSADIEIICHEPETTGGCVVYPLDKPGQTLHFFSVKNNHRLVINQLE